ncbi:hypothetical protein LP419_14055 [Massilia sp. H-1]|nr:hypothetical protein LP419_14055 [Massilia sp. H-1]
MRIADPVQARAQQEGDRRQRQRQRHHGAAARQEAAQRRHPFAEPFENLFRALFEEVRGRDGGAAFGRLPLRQFARCGWRTCRSSALNTSRFTSAVSMARTSTTARATCSFMLILFLDEKTTLTANCARFCPAAGWRASGVFSSVLSYRGEILSTIH